MSCPLNLIWVFQGTGVSSEHMRNAVINVRQRLGSSERRTCQVLD